MRSTVIILLLFFSACKGGQRVPLPKTDRSEKTAPDAISANSKIAREENWERKIGKPEKPLRRPAYEVHASEIRGEKLRQVLEDPNNNTSAKGDGKSLLDSSLGWDPRGKRIFFIRIHPISLDKEVDSLGEVGVRLGDCDSKGKLEYPYTYYVFPKEFGGEWDRVPKFLQENDKNFSSLKRKNYSHYLEETRRVLVAFSDYCITPGENRLEVQVLGEELYSFPFVFEYD